MPQKKDDDHRVPLDGPLYLAEARYLQHELRKLGVDAWIRSDRSLGARRDRAHILYVSPDDVQVAERARDEFLDEAEEDNEGSRGSDHQPRRLEKGPLVFGVLGFITGLRVGTRSAGSAWLGIASGVLLGVIAFFGAWMFVQSSSNRR